MFPDTSPPMSSQPYPGQASAMPAAPVAVPAQAKTGPSRLELQEDFGRIIRRIMYSNTNFQQVQTEDKASESISKTFVVENAEWSMCRSEAQLAAAQNRFEVSELLWLRALEIATTFAAGDPRLPQTLDELASLYFARKQYDKAESFGKQALEICRRSFGEYHPKVAYCANNLAGIYFCQEYFKKAEPHCAEVLKIYTRILSPDHPDVGMAHGNLAMLYKKQGKYQLALSHCESALPIRTTALGVNHHLVRALQTMQLELLELCGETDKAAAIKEKTLSNVGWKLFDSNISLTEDGELQIQSSLKKLL